MKNLIDYDPKELEHIVKYNDLYKIASYVLFVLFIFMAMLYTVQGDRADYYKGMLKIQDSCYTNALYEQKLSIDTAKWYKEMGVKMEVENE